MARERSEFEVGAPRMVEQANLAAKGGYGRIFKIGAFRNLWIGQTISGIGDWLVVGLLIPLVSSLAPGSSMAVAGIMIAKIIPSLLIGSVLGVLVDRFDRRRLMITTNLINGVLCLGLITASTGVLLPGVALAVIYAITFLMEINNLLFVPAKNAIIPDIVEERDLAAANGLSYTTQQASMLIGLVASGAIVSTFGAFLKAIIAAQIPLVSAFVASQPDLIGPQGGIVLDFFSFLIAAALFATVRCTRNESQVHHLDLRMIGRDVVESWSTLREHRELRGFLTSIGFAILGGGALFSVGLVYVQQNLVGSIPFLDLVPALQRVQTQGPQTFMLVFLGLGMFLGAVLVPKMANRVSLELLFVTGIAGFGFALLGFSVVNIYWIASVFGAIAGYLIAQVTVAGNTYVSVTVAEDVRGRIFAALESVLRVAILASIVLMAPLGDLAGSIVRTIVETTGGDPTRLVLTGSRITLVLASLIVLSAAIYANFAIDWRRKRNGALTAEEAEEVGHA